MFDEPCEVSVEQTMTENMKSPMARTFDQDLTLVHACKNGDAAAFEQLVKKYDCNQCTVCRDLECVLVVAGGWRMETGSDS
jgi:hypothetical protein